MQHFNLILSGIQLITSLKNFDRWLFSKVNYDWTNPLLDYIFPVWREAITWVPLYLFLLLFILLNFGYKAGTWMVGFVVTFALCDQLSSHLLKPLVQRPRPCLDPLLSDHINLLLNYCSDSFSFVSSHATNHFGMAFFIHYTLKRYTGRWTYLFFIWAASISYAQVYIGVHYPFDVICGGLLGSGVGCFVAYVFNKKFGLPPLLDSTTVAAQS